MRTSDIKQMLNQKVVIKFKNSDFPQVGVITDVVNKNIALDFNDWHHFSRIESVTLKEYDDVLNSAKK